MYILPTPPLHSLSSPTPTPLSLLTHPHSTLLLPTPPLHSPFSPPNPTLLLPIPPPLLLPPHPHPPPPSPLPTSHLLPTPTILHSLQIVKNPVENGLEMVMENVQQLRTLINRIRSDRTLSTNPLTMKLNGTLDAAVNGGVSKFEVGRVQFSSF